MNSITKLFSLAYSLMGFEEALCYSSAILIACSESKSSDPFVSRIRHAKFVLNYLSNFSLWPEEDKWSNLVDF